MDVSEGIELAQIRVENILEYSAPGQPWSTPAALAERIVAAVVEEVLGDA